MFLIKGKHLLGTLPTSIFILVIMLLLDKM